MDMFSSNEMMQGTSGILGSARGGKAFLYLVNVLGFSIHT